MKKNLLISLLILCQTIVSAQVLDDVRPTIAVPVFKSDNQKHDKYLAAITAKVTEVLKKSNRFNVVNRTEDEVKAERKFQKSEEFLDRTINAQDKSELVDMVDSELDALSLKSEIDQQGRLVFYGAQFILQGEIRKLDIVKMLNVDNTTAGYKALLSVQLAVNTTQTNTLTQAFAIDSKPIKVAMLSPERAVDEAIKTLEVDLASYFYRTFPLTCAVSKCEGNDVIINAGKIQGVEEGARFNVVCVEDMGGEQVELLVGEIKVKNVAGGNFSQCSVVKGKKDIFEKFSFAKKLKCILII